MSEPVTLHVILDPSDTVSVKVVLSELEPAKEKLSLTELYVEPPSVLFSTLKYAVELSSLVIVSVEVLVPPEAEQSPNA